MHVHGPGKQQCQAQSLNSSTTLSDHKNAENCEKICDGIESHGVPVPTAVVYNEVLCRLVEQLVLFLQDRMFLTKGADAGCSPHALVEVGVHGATNCATNSVQLVVNVKVGFTDVVDGIEEEWQEDKDFCSGELEHRGEDNDKVCTDFDHSPQSTIHVLKDVNISVENLQDLANWSHIKEEVNRSIQDLLESLSSNLLSDFMVAFVNYVVLSHVKYNPANCHPVKCSHETCVAFIMHIDQSKLLT